MARSQTLRLSLALLMVAAITATAFVVISVPAEGQYSPTIPTWPAFAMTYETNGVTYSIGSAPPVTTREVGRLDYQSATHWTDTVIEAPTVPVSVGATSRTGFSTQLRGRTYTESNADGGSIYSDTIDEDTTRTVGSMPPPFPIAESGINTEVTTTTAKVCFLDECVEIAPSILYRKVSGTELVFADDARGIPLRVGESFVVRELHIQGVREALDPQRAPQRES